ncbi:MAG: rod-binding protein [Lachnospiraceae bacterium]|nr:rod-binding protein [Lachnospiraceae bacterium]
MMDNISGLNGAYADYYKSMADDVTAQSLKRKAAAAGTAGSSSETDDELMDVCKQFESYLLEQVMKGMEKTIMRADDKKDASTENLVDFFRGETLKTIAQQSTESSPLGLAQMLYDQLKINMGISPDKISEIAAENGAADPEET